jgi:hypothetical protein
MRIKGQLINTIDGEWLFRVYSRDGNFKDYGLMANDMSIVIDDNSLKIVDIDEETGYIDYTDKVLGK